MLHLMRFFSFIKEFESFIMERVASCIEKIVEDNK